MCQRRFGASERRACRVLGQARSTQRRPAPVRPPAEARLRARLRDISRAHPRWGYRRVRIELTKEGWSVNTKRVHRLWRDEELQVRPRRRKRHRGTSTIDEVIASRPDEVWALDFQFDATADGRQLKLLHGVDEFTREALVMRVGRSCDADQVVRELERIVAERGAPSYLRCTTGRSSSLRRSRTGTASPRPARCSSSRARRGRTLRRVLQRQGTRRAAEHDRVLHACRGHGAGRRLPDGLQLAPAPLIARRPGSGRVR